MTNVFCSYSRKQALADGMLIDVSYLAKELGFVVPVAVTAGVWEKCVNVPEAVSAWQDETGRLWDVLNMFRLKARSTESNFVQFETFVRNEEHSEPVRVSLFGHCGPGDEGERVMTIMLPADY